MDLNNENKSKDTQFKQYLNSGMDRVSAYQLAYDVSHEDAVMAICKENYQYLIDSGLSEEAAYKIAFRENLNKENSDKTI